MPSSPEADSLSAAAAAVRQPILDAHGAPYGYELHDPCGTGTAIRHFLAGDEARRLAQRRPLFLPPHPAWLQDESVRDLPAGTLVLQVPTPRDDDPALVAAWTPMLQSLHAAGLRLALPRAALKKAYAPWLELAAFVKLDAAAEPALLASLLGFVERQTRAQAIAVRVDSRDAFERLRALGVPLFQGRWFAQATPGARGTLRPAQAAAVQLVKMLQQDADIEEVAPLLKRDPSLSFNLLRIINSAAMGLSFEVTSLQHAMLLLGRKKLLRWAVSLMAMARAEGTAPAVTQAALLRGRLMELLVAELLPPEHGDAAFVTGIFSLLDVLLAMPLAAALDSVALPEAVADALLRGEGLYAPFLALTMACEQHDEQAFARAAEALQLSNHQVNWAHLQALAWAEELASDER